MSVSYDFFTLPLEVRIQIYRLVLPYTLKTNSLRSTPSTPSNAPTAGNAATGALLPSPPMSAPLHRSNSMTSLMKSIKQPPVHCTLWQRGCTSILATNRRIHGEAADVLYGDNTFSLMISYDKIQFHYAWQMPSGIQPQGRVDAAQWFENGYLRRLRSLVVTVEYVDGYTATMKYNCGSAGLVAGLRGQLNKLVRIIRRRPEELPLRSVEIRSVGGARRIKHGDVFDHVLLPEAIVEPLRRLRRVQHAKATNDFGPQVARALEEAMMGDSSVDASEDEEVHQLRDHMRRIKVSRWKDLAEPISPAGYYPMASARLQGFNEI